MRDDAPSRTARGVAAHRLEPLVVEPVRGDAAGGLGRRVVSHVLILQE